MSELDIRQRGLAIDMADDGVDGADLAEVRDLMGRSAEFARAAAEARALRALIAGATRQVLPPAVDARIRQRLIEELGESREGRDVGRVLGALPRLAAPDHLGPRLLLAIRAVKGAQRPAKVTFVAAPPAGGARVLRLRRGAAAAAAVLFVTASVLSNLARPAPRVGPAFGGMAVVIVAERGQVSAVERIGKFAERWGTPQ